jgi:hypothetical protein
VQGEEKQHQNGGRGFFHVFINYLMTQNYPGRDAYTARYGPGGGTCKIFAKSVIAPRAKRRTFSYGKKSKNVLLAR